MSNINNKDYEAIKKSIKELDYLNNCIENNKKADFRKTPIHNHWAKIDKSKKK